MRARNLLCKKLQSEILKCVTPEFTVVPQTPMVAGAGISSGRCSWRARRCWRCCYRVVITKNSDDSFTYTRNTKSLVWDDKMYFYPIPDSELRKNPNLTQNTDW